MVPKSNAFTKEDEGDLRDIEKELMEPTEVVLRKKGGEKGSPRSQSVLAHYQ